jgi:hypothetical protein
VLVQMYQHFLPISICCVCDFLLYFEQVISRDKFKSLSHYCSMNLESHKHIYEWLFVGMMDNLEIF